MPPLAAVLFDLDGTLIDSIELILRSLEHTLARHGKPAQPRAQLLGGVGIPLGVHLRRFAADETETEAMVGSISMRTTSDGSWSPTMARRSKSA